MADIGFSDVQQAAAKWTLSVEARAADGVQEVQKAGIDFGVGNVSFSKHQGGVTSARFLNPSIAEPTVLLDCENADAVGRSVTRFANDHRKYMDAYKALALVAETANKNRDTAAKVSAEFASGHVKQLEKHGEKIVEGNSDQTTEIASQILSLAGNAFGSVSKGQFFGKKGSAAFKMFSDMTGQAAGIVKTFGKGKSKEKEFGANESQRKLETFKASMTGLMALEQSAAGTVDMIREKVKEFRDADGRGISLS